MNMSASAEPHSLVTFGITSAWGVVNVSRQRFRCKREPDVSQLALYRDFDFGHIWTKTYGGLLDRLPARCLDTARGRLPFPLLAASGGG